MEERIIETHSAPAWQLPAIIVLGIIAIGGLAFGYNASSKLDSTQQSVASQLKTEESSVQQDVSSLKDRLAQDDLQQIEPNLAEWNYGDYEGRRSADIDEERPGWNIFRDGCPNGESPSEIGERADRRNSRHRSATH